MLDLHTHILPGVDDGSSSVEMSIAMLEAEAQQGVSCVMATPHFYAHRDWPETFFARREKAWNALAAAAVDRSHLPRVLLGAEVSYYNGMSESEVLPEFCLGQSPYLLVEMPMGLWPERTFWELQAIYDRQGITPILAHVERYFPVFGKEQLLQRLETLPVLLQVNAGYILDRKTAASAKNLLQQGRVHLLGSDCHNMEDRPPRLGQAVQQIRQQLGEDVLARIGLYKQRILSP